MIRKLFLVLCASLALSAAAAAYTVKLKDGSLIFAKMKYTVKGTKAIITFPNGIVTQIDLGTIDVPGTEKYNRENPGNVIALDNPGDAAKPVPTAEPIVTIQDMIKRRKTRMEQPPSNPVTDPSKEGASGQSWQPVDQTLQAAFSRVFDGAGIGQYRLQNYRGTVKLLVTANTEQAVFNTISAAARAISDHVSRGGNTTTIEIGLTTSSGESAGAFLMTAEQARFLVNGGITVQDYFVHHVVL